MHDFYIHQLGLINLACPDPQTIPRNVVFDKKTGTNILQWPVEEVEKLRLNSTEFDNVKLEPGSIVPLNISPATQVCS